MRILSLTAGAAGMYCGTCLRDNALAAELLRQGHDVLLLPIYTPTRTDEQNVSHERIFFGGISVYLQQHSWLFRHLPAALDALWDSQWALRQASRRSIPVDPKLLGEMTVSMLRGESGYLRKEVQKLVDWLRTQPSFDVIDLPYSLLIGLAKPLREALGRPVCCTLQGEDLFLEGLTEPYRSECLALIRQSIPHVSVFIAVSRYYADHMASYLQIPRDRIRTVPLGINLDGHGWVERADEGPLRIGFFARIAPEKGLHVLCEAYRKLRERAGREFRLDVGGFLPSEHKPYLEKCAAAAGGGFHYHGELDRERKIHFFQSIHVLSVPSPYHEPKGLFLLEAMANGAAVVQPRVGAYPEILEKTGGGLLVDGSAESVAEALRHLSLDRDRTRQLGRKGAEGVRLHYSIERMARETHRVYAEAAGQVRAGSVERAVAE